MLRELGHVKDLSKMPSDKYTYLETVDEVTEDTGGVPLHGSVDSKSLAT